MSLCNNIAYRYGQVLVGHAFLGQGSKYYEYKIFNA